MCSLQERGYKAYRTNLDSYSNKAARAGVVKQYAQQVERQEGRKQIRQKSKFKLPPDTLKQLWPNFEWDRKRAETQTITNEAQPLPPGITTQKSTPSTSESTRKEGRRGMDQRSMSWNDQCSDFLTKIGRRKSSTSISTSVSHNGKGNVLFSFSPATFLLSSFIVSSSRDCC